jgi:hypothetical protein
MGPGRNRTNRFAQAGQFSHDTLLVTMGLLRPLVKKHERQMAGLACSCNLSRFTGPVQLFPGRQHDPISRLAGKRFNPIIHHSFFHRVMNTASNGNPKQEIFQRILNADNDSLFPGSFLDRAGAITGAIRCQPSAVSFGTGP